MKENTTENESNPEQASTVSISDQIRNWNSLNRSTINNSSDWDSTIEKVVMALNGLTSFFMLTHDMYKNSDHIHIYAGIQEGRLTLFYIDAKKDTANVDIDTAMTPLPLYNIEAYFNGDTFKADKNNTHNAVSTEQAIRRIYRWGTNWLRSGWIQDTVVRPISDDDNLNFLFSVLVIETSDLKQLPDATQHACFLSLKEHIENTKVVFSPDLTIADIDVDSNEVNYMLEDVVYSIPPIKPKFEYASFGALKQLVPNPKA